LPKENSDVVSSENMTIIAMKILRGSAFTQNVLGGSIIYHLLCMSVKNYENRLTYYVKLNERRQRGPCFIETQMLAPLDYSSFAS